MSTKRSKQKKKIATIKTKKKIVTLQKVSHKSIDLKMAKKNYVYIKVHTSRERERDGYRIEAHMRFREDPFISIYILILSQCRSLISVVIIILEFFFLFDTKKPKTPTDFH